MQRLHEAIWDEFDSVTETSADWFLPELRSALPKQLPAEDLGLRRLLEQPGAAAPRLPSNVRRLRRGRPDWPDAA